MLTYSSLVLISISIGVLVGAVGVGGFFMPTALTLVAGVTIHQGTATSLFTFIFTGIVGAIYFHKKGSINWSLVGPICIGAVLTGFAGAWVGSKLSTTMLSGVLAVMIMSAGIYTLAAGDRATALAVGSSRKQWLILAGIGAITGFLSGLTGIGGPALSVPLMMLCGYSILSAIGAGQVLQIVGALSGTIANLKFGTIDFGLAWFITIFEICGVLLGAYIIHKVDIRLIKKFVGVLCVVAGFAFMFRTL
ncbi:sulfite exporter TauE/SafE family protein [Herminiimonas contaminans]|uniref:Probable membrane transporter protein n=1 Tax=Herminiimonas contaminans TaxID=1111140 RepID=A0ABS0EYV2_9BURK|nr:sulfite exporter TauE/SafE family protein [Herminiimonas contaminans]MBF8179699.1 sulfite exporter TauE/SafE family protein [Herminiimonas contaminans]